MNKRKVSPPNNSSNNLQLPARTRLGKTQRSQKLSNKLISRTMQKQNRSNSNSNSNLESSKMISLDKIHKHRKNQGTAGDRSSIQKQDLREGNVGQEHQISTKRPPPQQTQAPERGQQQKAGDSESGNQQLQGQKGHKAEDLVWEITEAKSPRYHWQKVKKHKCSSNLNHNKHKKAKDLASLKKRRTSNRILVPRRLVASSYRISALNMGMVEPRGRSSDKVKVNKPRIIRSRANKPSHGKDDRRKQKYFSPKKPTIDNLRTSQQIQPATQGLQNQAGQVSDLPEVTQGNDQPSQTGTQYSQNQGENTATDAGDGGSLGAFSPLATATGGVAKDAFGVSFLQETGVGDMQATGGQVNGGQATGGQATDGLGQTPTGTANGASNGVQQTPTGAGTETTPTGNTIPEWGQCCGTYNGGVSGSCAEGNQRVCKYLTYCQYRTPDADGSLAPSGAYWPSATRPAGDPGINGAAGGDSLQATGGAATGDTATDGGSPQPTSGNTGTGGSLQPTGGANSSGTTVPPNGGGIYTGSADYSPTSYPPPTSAGNLPPAGPTNDYHCNGVSAQKNDLYNNDNGGGNSQNHAIGTQENFLGNCGHDSLRSTYQAGDGKGGTAANCGAYKNNIAAIGSSCGIANSYKNDDSGLCKELNSNLSAAMKCQHQQISNLGQQ
ncbi:hypothetical protein ABVK25_010565 [Lepraria finkii]|uniref:Uncharacterized protein n=1 Tax=Lepraria finkii TaxID=1340010 RepID=A0ABR4AU50_9LECA